MTFRRLAGAAPLAAAAFIAAAAAPRPAFSRDLIGATLAVGVRHDSNVSVEDTDVILRRGDDGLTLSAALRLAPVETKRTTLRLGYSFDDTLYRDLSEFDLAIHSASAGLSQRIGKTATLAADYQFSHVVLGGTGYLDMHLGGPSASAFVARNLFVRAAGTVLTKRFATPARRLDAETWSGTTDAYRFFARRKGYVALGLRYDDETARGAEFSFTALQAGLRAQIPFRLFRADTRARAGLAWQQRWYRNDTPSIGTERRETRVTVNAGLELSLTRALSLRPQARYVDRRSNVALYDYREYSLSTALALKL